MQTNEEAPRVCCERPKTLKLLIDGGKTPDITVEVCQEHSELSCFNKFIKAREEL